MQVHNNSDLEPWQGDGWVARACLFYARSFPDHPAKIRVFRWLGRTLFPHGLPLVGHSDTRIRVDSNDYIGHHIAFSLAYEPLSIALAKRLLAGGGMFLDVGANFGLYTCPIARLPGVQCIAVDASATAFSMLQANLRLNPGIDVRAINVGLGREPGLLVLETPILDNLGTTRVTAVNTQGAEGSCMVACMRLGDLMADLGVDHVEVMKIDVEGFEAQVMQGMDLAASYGPRHIIMEHSVNMSSAWHDPLNCHSMLLANGYRPYTVTGVPYSSEMHVPEENIWWSRDATCAADWNLSQKGCPR